MADNVWDEMRLAISRSQDTLRAADNVANSMAGLLRDRLRHVHNTFILAQLKAELRNFNSNTRQWKD